METGFFFFIIHANPSVLTVPMRNGNTQAELSVLRYQLRSYRTYEEWKPQEHRQTALRFLVLTVPMRNGNRGALQNSWGVYKFLPYL